MPIVDAGYQTVDMVATAMVATADQLQSIRTEVLSQLQASSSKRVQGEGKKTAQQEPHGGDSSSAQLVEDSNIQRFFRATSGNQPNTVKRLVATAKWRLEVNPPCVDCAYCLKDPSSHYLHM